MLNHGYSVCVQIKPKVDVTSALSLPLPVRVPREFPHLHHVLLVRVSHLIRAFSKVWPLRLDHIQLRPPNLISQRQTG